MFLENEFYLMNKDDRILRFTCDNSPLGVSFKEEESYEEIRPYGYDGSPVYCRLVKNVWLL